MGFPPKRPVQVERQLAEGTDRLAKSGCSGEMALREVLDVDRLDLVVASPRNREQRRRPRLARGMARSPRVVLAYTAAAMSAEEVDQYLRALEEPKRSTLQALRKTVLEIIPEAEQVISYRVPAFRVGGKTIAGFAAFKDHLSYLPFSGSVLGQVGDELEGYAMTKSSLHFGVDRPLPKALVGKLIEMRLADVRRRVR
jgi:uncharacterized protein YdhG (YjbR/CyaY superfamily)